MCCRIIGKNLSQDLRESELAELAGQSASAFSRYFRRHTGVAFVQYVNRLRINLACQLLMAGELSITEICFGSASTTSRISIASSCC